MSAITKIRPPTDRRLARSAATRTAVVEAMLGLIEAGDLRPTAPRIAARAGVSLRSVFQHFADLDALFAAAADRQTARFTPLLRALPVSGSLAQRVAAAAAQRAAVYEAVMPVRRAALLMEPFSSEIASRLNGFRGLMRRELARVFAAELAACNAAERRELLAALASAGGFSAWFALRRHQGLGVVASRRVLARTFGALLGVR
ncbi:MAG: TetR/AcrR family transcriptional regulator [bacterium]